MEVLKRNEYLKILNIDDDSDIETIKKAYRKLSIKYHPSLTDNTTIEMYNNITNAYKYLIDNYNSKFISNKNCESDEINIGICRNNTIIKRSNDSSEFNYNIDKNQIDYNNYNNYNKYKDDINIILDITYEQSFCGANIPIIINRFIVNNNFIKTEKETLYIEIPNGIDDNEIIILKNKGNNFNNNISDVKISTNVLKHDIFTRNGLDIVYNAKISFKESLTGFNFVLKHLNGKYYKIINTKGEIIHNKTTKTLYKLGFSRDNFYGNLVIIFDIEYPKSLSPNIIEKLYEIL